MDKHSLPTSVTIKDVECKFNADYRSIIKIFEIMSDPNLLDEEKMLVSLDYFYVDNSYACDTSTAISEMISFLNCGEHSKDHSNKNSKPLYDWEQDFNIIIAPINKILGYDVRSVEFLHFWTFMSAFMEIGESTFSTFVRIRDKMNRGKNLDKVEEKIYRENKDKILLKKRVDDATQAEIDAILGR